MRLFLALDVNKQTRAALYAFEQQMKRAGITGNYVPMANFHVTIHFFGETDRLGEIGLAMAEAVRGIKPFSLTLDSVGAFSNTAVVRLGGELNELKALYESTEAALANVGFVREKRPLAPHITLSRRTAPLEALEGLKDKLAKTMFYVDQLVLYESTREKHGMVYTPLQRVKI